MRKGRGGPGGGWRLLAAGSEGLQVLAGFGVGGVQLDGALAAAHGAGGVAQLLQADGLVEPGLLVVGVVAEGLVEAVDGLGVLPQVEEADAAVGPRGGGTRGGLGGPQAAG